MSKRKKLGQHFLISKPIAKKIVSVAKITKNDTVLEIGTGKGILVPFLCERAKKVVSIESDKNLYLETKSKFSNLSNLVLKHGDGFKTNAQFSIFVSNLPYSKSRPALEWLMQKKFAIAVIMIQKEFAEKLFSSGKDRKAISILANYALNMEPIMDVNKNNFSPPPQVNSTIIKVVRKKTLSKDLIKTVNNLFSYRRKTLQNVMKQFGAFIESKKRLEELPGDEIIEIAKNIIRKKSL
jgi:16S rRNA (adenine1518-N6/adenine1519-N6)-dimethyltransferase